MSPHLPDRIIIDEILPPPGKGTRPTESELAKFLAKWLDDFLRIPGTDFKIGLDPIISLIPGVGSSVASGGGLIILIEAVRSGVTLPVLLRMALNMIINTLFDFIPGLGPIASAFFKSNSRNLSLLQSWQTGNREAVRRSTFAMFLCIGGFFALLISLLFALWFFYIWLLRTYVFTG